MISQTYTSRTSQRNQTQGQRKNLVSQIRKTNSSTKSLILYLPVEPAIDKFMASLHDDFNERGYGDIIIQHTPIDHIYSFNYILKQAEIK